MVSQNIEPAFFLRRLRTLICEVTLDKTTALIDAQVKLIRVLTAAYMSRGQPKALANKPLRSESVVLNVSWQRNVFVVVHAIKFTWEQVFVQPSLQL